MEDNKKVGFLCRKVSIKNQLGIHARAAAKLANLASEFESEIYMEKDGLRVNGKSIIGILTLAAESGCVVSLFASGKDAKEALDELVSLIENKFGEE